MVNPVAANSARVTTGHAGPAEDGLGWKAGGVDELAGVARAGVRQRRTLSTSAGADPDAVADDAVHGRAASRS